MRIIVLFILCAELLANASKHYNSQEALISIGHQTCEIIQPDIEYSGRLLRFTDLASALTHKGYRVTMTNGLKKRYPQGTLFLYYSILPSKNSFGVLTCDISIHIQEKTQHGFSSLAGGTSTYTKDCSNALNSFAATVAIPKCFTKQDTKKIERPFYYYDIP